MQCTPSPLYHPVISLSSLALAVSTWVGCFQRTYLRDVNSLRCRSLRHFHYTNSSKLSRATIPITPNPNSVFDTGPKCYLEAPILFFFFLNGASAITNDRCMDDIDIESLLQSK
jgi:hypothetical protein